MAKPEQPHTSPEAKALDDEQVHVPKGQSRGRFLLIVGLMIFTLVIFVVPDLFQDMFRRDKPQEESYFMWEHPRLGVQRWTYGDFVLERRKLDSALRMLGSFDPRDTREFKEDEQIGRLLVLDALAQEAGVEVSDAELRKVLTDGGMVLLSRPKFESNAGYPFFFFQIRPFGDAQVYKDTLARAQMTPTEFQESLRRLMRIERYENLLGLPLSAQPAAIEAAWKERHEELQFDYVAFDVEATQAALALPEGGELAQWYEGLDAGRKRALFGMEWRPERIAAEFVVWKYAEPGEPTALLEAYPRPAGADLEQVAKDYYTQFKNVRFRRAEPLTEGATADERLYVPYDEVAEQARRESLVHAALVDLSIDLQGRLKAGEIVDLVTEAAKLGLAYVGEADPKPLVEWTTYPEIGDGMLLGALSRAARGDHFVSITVQDDLMLFGRTTERVEASAPPFDEVQVKVGEEWKKERGLALAQERAQAFHDLLATKPPTTEPGADEADALLVDAAAFASMAQSQDLAVTTTAWLDSSEIGADDLLLAPEENQGFEKELSGPAGVALGFEPDQVSEPLTSSNQKLIYVVRKAGKRAPEAVAIDAKEYAQLKQNVGSEHLYTARDRMIGLEAMQTRFGLAFPGRKVREDVPPEPEPEQG